MISVIIPTYNHASSLRQTIESVLAQKSVELELIVIDDGSTEHETGRILDDYRDLPNVIAFRQENAGRNPARNKGFEFAKGEYLLFLDADADLDPDALSKLKHALDASDASFAYGDFRYGFKKFDTGTFDADRLRQQNYIHTSALIRRSDFPEFDENIKRFQDWDLWLTILDQGGKGVYVPGELMRFSTQEKGISSWLPKAWYHAPWKWLPWIAPRVKAYEQAKETVRKKHRLT